MVIAAVVIETVPGSASRVAERLSRIPDLELQGEADDRRLAAVWTAPTGEALEAAAAALVEADDEVLGVHPTFVARDDEGIEQ